MYPNVAHRRSRLFYPKNARYLGYFAECAPWIPAEAVAARPSNHELVFRAVLSAVDRAEHVAGRVATVQAGNW